MLFLVTILIRFKTLGTKTGICRHRQRPTSTVTLRASWDILCLMTRMETRRDTRRLRTKTASKKRRMNFLCLGRVLPYTLLMASHFILISRYVWDCFVFCYFVCRFLNVKLLRAPSTLGEKSVVFVHLINGYVYVVWWFKAFKRGFSW